MRNDLVYERTRTAGDPAEGSQYAYVISHGDERAKPHSRVSKYVEAPL